MLTMLAPSAQSNCTYCRSYSGPPLSAGATASHARTVPSSAACAVSLSVREPWGGTVAVYFPETVPRSFRCQTSRTAALPLMPRSEKAAVMFWAVSPPARSERPRVKANDLAFLSSRLHASDETLLTVEEQRSLRSVVQRSLPHLPALVELRAAAPALLRHHSLAHQRVLIDLRRR